MDSVIGPFLAGRPGGGVHRLQTMMAPAEASMGSTDTGATPLAASLDPSDPAILDCQTLDELRLLDRVKPGLLDQLMGERFEAKRPGPTGSAGASHGRSTLARGEDPAGISPQRAAPAQ